MKKKFTLIFLVIFTCLYGQNTEFISITLDSINTNNLNSTLRKKKKQKCDQLIGRVSIDTKL